MSKKSLYLECFSGISGDMTVAALIDLGADVEVLKEGLNSLNVSGYDINISRTQKYGIDACDFDVILEHDHKHTEEVHCHEHCQEHCHEHDGVYHVHEHDEAKDKDEHNEHHEHNEHNKHEEHHEQHEHEGHEHHGHHEHRNIGDIYKIIDGSMISKRAKDISKRIFDIVAIAESKAHGIEIENVHFHEVGAIDSIVDIVAVGICIDNLGIDDVIVSELYEGTGHVHCQHGTIPIPVPAVANIVIDNSLSIRITDAKGEMVTPTGAAIAAALKTKDSLPKDFKMKKIGLGAGKKDFAKANILRAIMIEETKKNISDEIWVLETNIDDSTGEALGFAMEKLLGAGAKDVFYTPIYMKKNRPAYKLSLLCSEMDIKTMESIIFKNTTSIGIRRYKVERTVLGRENIRLETKYGQVRFKVTNYEGETFYQPEYDDVKEICNKNNLSFNNVYNELKNIDFICKHYV